MPRNIILDCDPGHDDAIAMLLAHGNPEIDLVAVIGMRAVLTPSALAALTSRRQESSLTAREADVIRLVAQGLTNPVIARRLLISESTVKTHWVHVYAKLEVADRASAVRVAWERELV